MAQMPPQMAQPLPDTSDPFAIVRREGFEDIPSGENSRALLRETYDRLSAMNPPQPPMPPMMPQFDPRQFASGLGSFSPVMPYYRQGGSIAPRQYAAGGKFLQGPGDGMSDDIKANINGQQEARLADGEFVVPADVVSHLGNGSSNAGSRKLYKMMANVRKARTGKSSQAPAVKTDKYLPA